MERLHVGQHVIDGVRRRGDAWRREGGDVERLRAQRVHGRGERAAARIADIDGGDGQILADGARVDQRSRPRQRKIGNFGDERRHVLESVDHASAVLIDCNGNGIA
jgi:hypothetical protein